LKLKTAGLTQIRISLGSLGFVAATPGGTKGLGWSAGLVNGEAKVAVPPQVNEKGAVVELPAPT